MCMVNKEENFLLWANKLFKFTIHVFFEQYHVKVSSQLQYHLRVDCASACSINNYPYKPYISWKLNSCRLQSISLKNPQCYFSVFLFFLFLFLFLFLFAIFLYFSIFLASSQTGPCPLSTFDTHTRWQPVTQSTRSRQSYGKMEDCEKVLNSGCKTKQIRVRK